MAPSFFAVFVALCIMIWLSRPANTQAVGSFYFGRGSAVIVHNPDADNFLYSINSAKGFSDLQPIEVKAKPKNGTAIACTGYSGPTSVYGQVFYQSTNSSLAFLFFKCSYASGICVNYGEYAISTNLTTPVSPNTRLAAALFSKDIGYRVTYQDTHGSLRQLAYANNTQSVVTNWADGNLIGNFSIPDGHAISTVYASPSNTTGIAERIFAVGDREVRVDRAVVENMTHSIHDQITWVAGSSITNLPSFVPSLSNLATLTYNSWDCLFYIDSTSRLQFMRSTDGGLNWSLQPQMDISAWPLADMPNAPITASSSFNISDYSAYVYYQAGGGHIQARIRNSLWETAQVIQAPPNGTFISPNDVPSPDAPKHNKSSDAALKIGAGTGVAVAILLVLVILGCHFRRAKIAARNAREIEKPESIFDGQKNGSSEDGFVGKAELSGMPSHRAELDHDPECQLHHQLQARRVAELRGVVPGELESGVVTERWELNGEVRVGELDAGLCTCTCELDGGNSRKVFYELASPVSELGWDEREGKIDEVVLEKGLNDEKGDITVSELAAGSMRSRSLSGKESQADPAERAR